MYNRKQETFRKHRRLHVCDIHWNNSYYTSIFFFDNNRIIMYIFIVPELMHDTTDTALSCIKYNFVVKHPKLCIKSDGRCGLSYRKRNNIILNHYELLCLVIVRCTLVFMTLTRVIRSPVLIWSRNHSAKLASKSILTTEELQIADETCSDFFTAVAHQ